MPVHAVEGGFRFGSSGKVYKTREEAERQAAAIYANGWREDSPRGRRAKREMHVALSPSQRAESQYLRDLVGIMRGVHRGVMALADEHIGPLGHEARHDATRDPAGWQGLGERIAKHVRPRVGVAFDKMAELVNSKGQKTATLIGIAPQAPGVLAAIAQAKEDAIRYVEQAGRDYAEDVRDVMTDAENEGLRVEELRDLLVQRGSVSLSRAATIATTGVLNLASSLNEHRQRAAGVRRYQWSTVRDERVRPEHRELDGQTFSWDNPPDADVDGGPANPGQSINCRCVALPVLPGAEGGDEDDGSSELPDIAAEE